MADNTKSKKELKIDTLLADVRSGNSTKAKGAIQSLKVHGDSTVIEPLLRVYTDPKFEDLKSEIHAFLSDIHDETARPEFVRVAEEITELRNDVLNIVWNSKMDFSGYIDSIVALAVEGDFMTTVECLTIIENMQGPFEEMDLIECQMALAKYPEHPSKSEQKDQLISEIALLIQDIERNIEG